MERQGRRASSDGQLRGPLTRGWELGDLRELERNERWGMMGEMGVFIESERQQDTRARTAIRRAQGH